MRESNTSNNSLLSVYFKRLETHKECTTRAWMQRKKKIIIICVLSDLDRGEVAAPTEEVARGVDGAAGGRGFVVRRWNVTPGPPDLAR
jgi:hypothetical protein